MIVLDASVVLDLLLRAPAAVRLEERMFAPGESLHAPELLDVEVVSVLRRYAHAGRLGPTRGRRLVGLLRDLPITRWPHRSLLDRAFALRRNLTAYDAVYVALAEGLGAPLLTGDAALARAPGNRARIEVV